MFILKFLVKDSKFRFFFFFFSKKLQKYLTKTNQNRIIDVLILIFAKKQY